MESFKKVAIIIFTLIYGLCIFSCKGNKSTMLNKNKPLIFYNRQPSDPVTGKLDYSAVSWNNRTYYLGTDSQNGGETQGRQILDFLQNSDSIQAPAAGPGCQMPQHPLLPDSAPVECVTAPVGEQVLPYSALT